MNGGGVGGPNNYYRPGAGCGMCNDAGSRQVFSGNEGCCNNGSWAGNGNYSGCAADRCLGNECYENVCPSGGQYGCEGGHGGFCNPGYGAPCGGAFDNCGNSMHFQGEGFNSENHGGYHDGNFQHMQQRQQHPQQQQQYQYQHQYQQQHQQQQRHVAQGRRGGKGPQQHHFSDSAGAEHSNPSGKISQQAKHINSRICQAADKSDTQGLLDFVAARQAELTVVNISTALHKLARLVKGNPDEILAGDARVVTFNRAARIKLAQQAEDADDRKAYPRCWATIAWAYGTLPWRGPEVTAILKHISRLSVPCTMSFRPFEFTNLLWGFAKVGLMDTPVFQSANAFIEENIKNFSESNLSTLLWAFATVQYAPSTMLYRIAEEFVNQLPKGEATPVELSNLVWALASSKLHPKARIIKEVGKHAVMRMNHFKAQELSITAWSISRLGHRHDEFFFAAASRLMASPSLREQLHPQGVANTLWAFERHWSLGTRIRAHLVKALHMMLPICLRCFDSFKSQELVSVLRAISKMNVLWGMSQEADRLFLLTAWRGAELPIVLNVGGDPKKEARGRHNDNLGGADQTFQLSPLQSVNLVEAVLIFTSGRQGVAEVINACLVNLMQASMSHLCAMDLAGAQEETIEPGADQTDLADCRFRTFLRLSYMVVFAPDLALATKRYLLGQMAWALLQLRIENFASVDIDMLTDVCSLALDRSVAGNLRQALAEMNEWRNMYSIGHTGQPAQHQRDPGFGGSQQHVYESDFSDSHGTDVSPAVGGCNSAHYHGNLIGPSMGPEAPFQGATMQDGQGPGCCTPGCAGWGSNVAGPCYNFAQQPGYPCGEEGDSGVGSDANFRGGMCQSQRTAFCDGGWGQESGGCQPQRGFCGPQQPGAQYNCGACGCGCGGGGCGYGDCSGCGGCGGCCNTFGMGACSSAEGPGRGTPEPNNTPIVSYDDHSAEHDVVASTPAGGIGSACFVAASTAAAAANAAAALRQRPPVSNRLATQGSNTGCCSAGGCYQIQEHAPQSLSSNVQLESTEPDYNPEQQPQRETPQPAPQEKQGASSDPRAGFDSYKFPGQQATVDSDFHDSDFASEWKGFKVKNTFLEVAEADNRLTAPRFYTERPHAFRQPRDLENVPEANDAAPRCLDVRLEPSVFGSTNMPSDPPGKRLTNDALPPLPDNRPDVSSAFSSTRYSSGNTSRSSAGGPFRLDPSMYLSSSNTGAQETESSGGRARPIPSRPGFEGSPPRLDRSTFKSATAIREVPRGSGLQTHLFNSTRSFRPAQASPSAEGPPAEEGRACSGQQSGSGTDVAPSHDPAVLSVFRANQFGGQSLVGCNLKNTFLEVVEDDDEFAQSRLMGTSFASEQPRRSNAASLVGPQESDNRSRLSARQQQASRIREEQDGGFLSNPGLSAKSAKHESWFQ